MSSTKDYARAKRALLGSMQETVSSLKIDREVIFNVAIDLFETLDTAHSLSCAILLRYKEIDSLLSKTIDPNQFIDWRVFRDSYQAVSFLRKLPAEAFSHFQTNLDPVKRAQDKFIEAEASCRSTNRTFRRLLSSSSCEMTPVIATILEAAEEIRTILGTSIDAQEWLTACRFGPGAFKHTTARGLTSVYKKMQVQPSVTLGCAEIGRILVMSIPSWARSITDQETPGFWPIVSQSDLDIVHGNKIAFVPKTATTHRAIAVEPLLNLKLQLGIGTILRRRLKRTKVNLNTQLRNQRLAWLGSVRGDLATIDLSSASDTVAREFVRFMLPDSWFFVMDLTRSATGILPDGTELRYEKFSSMGNGFTFELETLLFLALARASMRRVGYKPSFKNHSVYGDDIVVPTDVVPLLTEVLRFCGFSLNREKTYAAGNFRESCGKDYFSGYDVRPFFQKETLDEIEHLFRLANGIRRLSHRRNNHIGCDSRLLKPWIACLRELPSSILRSVRIPALSGESEGIECNWDEAQASPFICVSRHGWEGWQVLKYTTKPVEFVPTNFLGAIAALLYARRNATSSANETSSSLSAPFVERGSLKKKLSAGFHQGPWTNFGPWI